MNRFFHGEYPPKWFQTTVDRDIHDEPCRDPTPVASNKSNGGRSGRPPDREKEDSDKMRAGL